MSAAQGKTRAWLELARITNLPTVWSNIFVGVSLGVVGGVPRGGGVWIAAAGAGLVASLLYVAGMILNDVVDTRFDEQHRPERPIPSGRVQRQMAAVVVAVLVVVAGGGAAALGRQACVYAGLLAASIVAYDVLHKKFAPAIVLMGLCRALVIPLATAAVTEAPATPLAVRAIVSVVVGLYTIVLTAGARQEHRGKGMRGTPWLLIVIAAAILVVVRPGTVETGVIAGAAGAVLVLWLVRSHWLLGRRPPRVIDAVLSWLSGFCLLDAWVLAVLGVWWFAVGAGMCFIVTVLAHRRMVGT